MKSKSNAQRIISADGLDIYYWVNWKKELTKNFKVLHPGSSMNHSSLEDLEKGLNERGFPTIVFDPRGVGYSQAPARSNIFSLENYSDDLQKIVEQEGLEYPSFLSQSFGFMPVVDYVSRTTNAEDIMSVCGSYNFAETTANKFLFHFFNQVFRYSEYAWWVGSSASHFINGDERNYNDQSGLTGSSDIEVGRTIFDVPFGEIKSHIISGKEINSWNVKSQLINLQVPMLLIYADKDLMVVPSTGDYIDNLTDANCTIEIVEGTHSLPTNNPERVLSVIDKYISE